MAPVVRRVYAVCFAGVGYNQIAAAFKRGDPEGIRT
jgi:hypothetical protein